jgi:hypothetical protein
MSSPKVVLTHGFCYVPGGVVPNIYTSVKIVFDGMFTVAVSWNPPYPSQQSVFYIRDIFHIPAVVLNAIRSMKDFSSPQQIIDRITELLSDFQKDKDEMEEILSAKLQPKLDNSNRVIAELHESRKQDHETIACLEVEVEKLQKREQELSVWSELSAIHIDELELTNRKLQLQLDTADRIERDTILEDALDQLKI